MKSGRCIKRTVIDGMQDRANGYAFLYKECGHLDHKSDRVDYRLALAMLNVWKEGRAPAPPRMKCYKCSTLAAKGEALPAAVEPLPDIVQALVAERASWKL